MVIFLSIIYIDLGKRINKQWKGKNNLLIDGLLWAFVCCSVFLMLSSSKESITLSYNINATAFTVGNSIYSFELLLLKIFVVFDEVATLVFSSFHWKQFYFAIV